jgi:hypothetical protein
MLKTIPDTTLFYVTLGALKRKRACHGQLLRFELTFGKGKRVYLSLANFRRALENGLSVSWLVWHLEEAARKKGHDVSLSCNQLSTQIHELTRYTDTLYEGCSDDEIKRAYDALVRFVVRATDPRAVAS